MNILVTGGAGFIGSNFTRYWVEHHPGDHAVVLDLLTYAGNRPNLDDVEDHITFVQGDIADYELAEQVLRSQRDRRRRELRRRVAQQPGRPRPGPVLPHQRHRHADAARGGAARSGSGASITSRRARCTATSRSTARTLFTETSSYRPRTPYNASKAGADHAVRAYHETYGLPVTITNCANNYGPYQFPEKVIPVFVTSALDDQPLQMYASTENRREWIHALDHCAAIDAVLERGPRGRDVPRRHGGREEHRGDRRHGARRARQARRPEDDHPRPARARPPVHPRLDEDPARARLGAADPVRSRARRDGAVVRAEPRLVGASPGAGAGRRGRCLDNDDAAGSRHRRRGPDRARGGRPRAPATR